MSPMAIKALLNPTGTASSISQDPEAILSQDTGSSTGSCRDSRSSSPLVSLGSKVQRNSTSHPPRHRKIASARKPTELQVQRLKATFKTLKDASQEVKDLHKRENMSWDVRERVLRSKNHHGLIFNRGWTAEEEYKVLDCVRSSSRANFTVEELDHRSRKICLKRYRTLLYDGRLSGGGYWTPEEDWLLCKILNEILPEVGKEFRKGIKPLETPRCDITIEIWYQVSNKFEKSAEHLGTPTRTVDSMKKRKDKLSNAAREGTFHWVPSD